MSRASYLASRLATLSVLGDGPWLDAARGRLDAAMGNEPWVPWYATTEDNVPSVIAWHRESGTCGYLNRGARKHLRLALLGPLYRLREALHKLDQKAVVTRGSG